MASSLTKERNYKYMAEKYSELNDFQIILGKRLTELIGIKRGNNVVDIGCGTGEITAYVADIVGTEGLCVGVDPDANRISIAKRKHTLDRKNLCFVHGDSSSNFPHCNEAFYDVVLCSSVFHWLNEQEKVTFLETTFRCLKAEGKIAILSQEKNPELFTRVPELLPDEEVERNRPPFNLVSKSDAEGMLQQAGFEVQCGYYFQDEYTFLSLENYLTWYCASGYVDESKILPQKKRLFAQEFVKLDGTINLKMTFYRIIATKPQTFC